jgi:phosphate uptake regulator
MFNKFKELFGSESLLDVAFDTTLKMLEYDHQMYDASRKTLRDSETAELPFDIKKMDRKINKYEREVRRNVLTHLTIAGTQNLAPGLALVSIVIDVERIGDYTKNIAGLAKRHPAKLLGGKHEAEIKKIEETIESQFPIIIEILNNQKKKLAREVLLKEEEIGSMSDDILNSLLLGKKDKFTTPDAVALAMYSRYLKRINAHITNIASSIVNPFPRIGFREKKK